MMAIRSCRGLSGVPLVLLAGALLVGCGSSDESPGTPDGAVDTTPDAAPDPTPDAGEDTVLAGFTRYLVGDDMNGPAYVSVADLDDDGTPELVVSALGALSDQFAGEVAIYSMDGDLGSWTKTTLTTDYRFPNQTRIRDMDGDQDLDIVMAGGFFVCGFLGGGCGSLVWFEQTDSGWVAREIATTDDEFYHWAEFVDLDGDDVDDLVTVGEMFNPASAELRYYPGDDSAVGFATTPVKIGDGLGGFPRVLDIDGDGDMDIAGAEFFAPGDDSFAWFEQTEGGWTRHVIDAGSGPSIQLTFIDDFYGDGKLRAIGSNHVNDQRNPPDEWESAIYAFEIPEDPTEEWPKTKISTGIQSRPGDLQMNRFDAPGIVGYGDVDRDGDIDVVAAGDGDPRAFLLEQTAPGQFTTHVLQTNIGQAGGMVVTDLDADDKPEIIVTGYEDNVIYVYERD